jgi:hypothetical protein
MKRSLLSTNTNIYTSFYQELQSYTITLKVKNYYKLRKYTKKKKIILNIDSFKLHYFEEDV